MSAEVPESHIRDRSKESTESPLGSIFVSSALGEQQSRQAGEWWDAVALGEFEEAVLGGLRLIEPGVERCAMASGPFPTGRMLNVKMAGRDRAIELASLGDGMNRLFRMILALVTARGRVLLVDEIETGLHHTVFPALWRLVLILAKQLDVQVFATTHSHDCLKGFQAALTDGDGELGRVVRLFRSNNPEDSVRATMYGADELELALNTDLELR